MEIENLNKTIFTMLKESRDFMGENTAIKYYHTKISYDLLFREVVKCMSSLKNWGVSEGDIVSICMPDIPQSIIALYAIVGIGAIANIIDPACSGYDLQYYINGTDSKFIFLIENKYPQISHIFCDSLKKIVIVTEKDYLNLYDKITFDFTGDRIHKIEETEDINLWETFMKKATPKCVQNYKDIAYIKAKTTDTALIIYSDYNLEPKRGILLSHYVFIEFCIETQKYFSANFKKGDKIRSNLPMFTGHGVGAGVINALSNGYMILLGKNNSKEDYLIGNSDWEDSKKKIKLKGMFGEGDNIDTTKDVQITSIEKYVGVTGYITINP